MVTKREKVYLACLYSFSLIIRLVTFFFYLAQHKRYWQVDSRTYHLIAENIAHGAGFSLNGAPAFYRLPGYPLFLSFFYRLFGFNPFYPLIAQIFIGACIPVIIFFIARQLFPARPLVYYGASGFASIHLGLVLYSGFLMTETLFIIFFLLFALFFFSGLHTRWCSKSEAFEEEEIDSLWKNVFLLQVPFPDAIVPDFCYDFKHSQALDAAYKGSLFSGSSIFKDMTLAGFFLGVASMFRPVGHYLLGLSLLIILVSQACRLWRFEKMCFLTITWLGVVGWWLIRNFLLTGHLFFHTLPGGHFLYLSAARVVAQVEQVSYKQARDMLHNQVQALIKKEEQTKKRDLMEIEKCNIHEQLARQYFATYPLVSAKLWGTDMFRTCFSLYSAELYYLENNRPEFDYFSSKRSWWSMFQRYLFPKSDNKAVKLISFIEMLLFLLIVFGFCIGLGKLLFSCLAKACSWIDLCTWTKIIPFMLLFIVISLAGGYARMRLPIEPFLFIFSLYGWDSILSKKGRE